MNQLIIFDIIEFFYQSTVNGVVGNLVDAVKRVVQEDVETFQGKQKLKQPMEENNVGDQQSWKNLVMNGGIVRVTL